MTNKKKSNAAQFIHGFGRVGDPVQFISTEPSAREKARQFARAHGGRVYRAVAVGRALGPTQARDLGRGYIVATTPPREFVYWGKYYAKVMELKDMSKTDRQRYIYARGIEVFEDSGEYRRWLRDPARALGNKIPASLIKTISGAQKVLDVLEQVEYGVIL